MKLNIMSAAIAAATLAVSGSSFASCTDAADVVSTLPGVCSEETDAGNPNANAQGVVAVAVVAACDTRNGLQALQGFDASCIGSDNVSCAPNISSAELRAIFSGGITAASAIKNEAGDDLATAVTADTACALQVTNFAIQGRVEELVQSPVDYYVYGNAGSTQGVTGTPKRVDQINAQVDNARMRFGLYAASELTTAGAEDLGFLKLDGSAPTLANTESSNYNLIANLHGDLSGEGTVPRGGAVFGVYKADASGAAASNMDGDGVAYHHLGGTANASVPASPRGEIAVSDTVSN